MDFKIESFAVWRASEAVPKPDVSFIPPMERRRLTGVERAALATAWQVRPARETPVVFASRWGEIGVTVKLMKQLHSEDEMSPAGFSASVHNAAPGAFSLLTKNHAPYTAIAARERSLEAGLLEALVLGRDVVFVYAEEATPEFYSPEFGELQPACSVSARLTPVGGGPCTVEFRHTECPAATFEAFCSFLEGKTRTFETSDFILKRD